jgi:hypothetical protein
MSQCSVVDRWVQSDHILLIHPCPEMLCLHTRAFEKWRRTPVGKQPIGLQSSRNSVKQAAWVLTNTLVDARRRHTPDFEEAVIQHFEEQPDTSNRSVAHSLSVKHMLLWQVLHDEHLHPYHLQQVQAMGPNDFAPHVNICQWLLGQSVHVPHFLCFIFFSDVYLYFHLQKQPCMGSRKS